MHVCVCVTVPQTLLLNYSTTSLICTGVDRLQCLQLHDEWDVFYLAGDVWIFDYKHLRDDSSSGHRETRCGECPLDFSSCFLKFTCTPERDVVGACAGFSSSVMRCVYV